MPDVPGVVLGGEDREPETGQRWSAAAWRMVTGNGQREGGACVVGKRWWARRWEGGGRRRLGGFDGIDRMSAGDIYV